MIEEYIKQLLDSGTPCNGVLPDGCRIPLPSSGDPWCIKEYQGTDKRFTFMKTAKVSVPTCDVMYLPYVPHHINICVQKEKMDIISAPFSGCHMVVFQYSGTCLFHEVNGETGKCPMRAFNCNTDCKLRYKNLIGHVAYEKEKKYSCDELWNSLRKKVKVLKDFEPYSGINQSIQDPIGGWTYAIVTASLDCHSLVIGYDNKIKTVLDYKKNID